MSCFVFQFGFSAFSVNKSELSLQCFFVRSYLISDPLALFLIIPVSTVHVQFLPVDQLQFDICSVLLKLACKTVMTPIQNCNFCYENVQNYLLPIRLS